jgi:hypothetical protein
VAGNLEVLTKFSADCGGELVSGVNCEAAFELRTELGEIELCGSRRDTVIDVSIILEPCRR